MPYIPYNTYYVPDGITGTVYAADSVTAGPPAVDPVMTGTPRDMVVACDHSRRVYGFINGAKKWHRDYPAIWPRGLDIYKGVLFIANGNDIDLVCPTSGQIIRTITVPNSGGVINGVRVSEWGGHTWVTLALGVQGVGSVRLYKLTGSSVCAWSLAHHLSSPQAASHPRDAIVAYGWCFVADTFNHRVYGFDIPSGGQMRDITDIYYPNTVDLLASNRVVICAEHENRVLEWKYSPAPAVRTMLFSAPVAPFNDITKTKADVLVVEGTAATIDAGSAFTPKKSQCAVECSGVDTLYSPNSARVYGNNILIADTDNQRVIIVNGGTVVTEVTGFNCPVNAVLINP